MASTADASEKATAAAAGVAAGVTAGVDGAPEEATVRAARAGADVNPNYAASTSADAESEGEAIDVEIVEVIEPASSDEASDETETSTEGGQEQQEVKLRLVKEGLDEASEEEVPGKRTRRRRWPLTVALILVISAVVCAGLFCWQRWWRFDDAADIQGVWKVEATGDTIVFDSRNLKLTKSISYEYRLDPNTRTITYSFGDKEGGGHYYFDEDRDRLVILDGDEQLGVLAELGFLPQEKLASDSATDNTTVLAKVSDDTSAEPSGNANGLLSGQSNKGEREFMVKPEPSSSSSSGGSKSSSSSTKTSRSSSADDEDELDDETQRSRSSRGTRSTSADEDDDSDSYESGSTRRSSDASGSSRSRSSAYDDDELEDEFVDEDGDGYPDEAEDGSELDEADDADGESGRGPDNGSANGETDANG